MAFAGRNYRRVAAGTWSFFDDCPSCRRLRRFLVSEHEGPGLQSHARCRSCTRLIPVTAAHRAAPEPIPAGLLDAPEQWPPPTWCKNPAGDGE